MLVGDFVEWSNPDPNQLLLNVAKTMEMVVDFRRKRTATPSLNIRGACWYISCSSVTRLVSGTVIPFISRAWDKIKDFLI